MTHSIRRALVILMGLGGCINKRHLNMKNKMNMQLCIGDQHHADK